ncbi:hypothetical protein ACQ4M3_39380 [Leptolyngbya sp. AN03gr2]|uniref:hypothetical protein n=1 Tax=unclassified Leptolyngbya TaxID=2650499 RepID=UPI003D31B71C
MKTLAAIFVPALVGILIGGGAGYFWIGTKGQETGKLAGTCLAVDAAVAAKVLTPEQAEKLGAALGTKTNLQAAQELLKSNENSKEGCRRALQGIVQAAK